MSIAQVISHSPSPQPCLLDQTGIIIPTLNAAEYLKILFPLLAEQGVPLTNICVVDSASDDETVAMALDFGASVTIIPRKDFNHGGTRRMASELDLGTEILVYMTQDAIPADAQAIQNLVAAFADPSVGMAYGRQLPRKEARAIETHARLRNYPDTSEIRSFEDRHRLGARTVFCSNSFAAYRRSALIAAGNFPQDAFFAEDQIVAARLLKMGWKLAYQADAQVYHSHDYSIREEFKRYFDVGVFHARNRAILDDFGAVEGEGFKFVCSELKFLWPREPLSIPSALVRTLAKYIAYKIGNRESMLPTNVKISLSMQPFYWRKTSSNP